MRLALGPHGPLPLLEEELLGAEHRAWTHDAQVTDHFCAGEAVVLHEVPTQNVTKIHWRKRVTYMEMRVPVRPRPALQCTAIRPGSDSESSRN